METPLREVRLIEAAQRLRLGYGVCLDLVLRGKLAGRQTAGRRGMVSESDVERLANENSRQAELAST